MSKSKFTAEPLTAEKLRALLIYDPETGVFIRISNTHKGRWKSGRTAGYVRTSGVKTGYVCIGIGQVEYLAHRLAFLFMTGEWPKQDVDHIDSDTGNNRWVNLRDVSRKVNMQNVRGPTKGNKSTGLLGVTAVFNAKGEPRFKMQIRNPITNKKINSTHDTGEEAHAEYIRLKRIHHPGNML